MATRQLEHSDLQFLLGVRLDLDTVDELADGVASACYDGGRLYRVEFLKQVRRMSGTEAKEPGYAHGGWLQRGRNSRTGYRMFAG